MPTQKMKSQHRDRVLKQARISVKNGRRVVPIPHGKKGPVISGWPTLRLAKNDLEQYFGESDGIGWLTGKVSGDLIDIDLDCKAAVTLGKVFLPETDRIHGREGRKTSHYWYLTTPVPRPMKFADVDGESLIEIRSDGQQTLIPPSIHPNGKCLQWEAIGKPARVEAEVLCQAVAKIAAGALVARHWPGEGQRHDAAKALAGILLRAGWKEKETAVFVEAVAEAGGDDEAHQRVKDVASTAKRLAAGGKATGGPSLGSIIGDDVVSRLRQFLQIQAGEQAVAVSSNDNDWPDPAPLGDELPPVQSFDLDLLPESFRPLVEDVAERMQVPADFPAAASVLALAGCANRRARMQPKAEDGSWSVVLNLWGAIVGPPGFMKTPVLNAITAPLRRIEDYWRADHANKMAEYKTEKAEAELRAGAWKQQYKKAITGGQPAPPQPDDSLVAPVERRLITTDSTFEKLHELLGHTPDGLFVLRDELPGWLAQLERAGREGERAFYLQAWSGDMPYTLDRIGRGSIHVPEVCVSLVGNIQPARLRWYLNDAVRGGANDDGLFQRFQVTVWPDLPSEDWKLVDRPPNAQALATAERVYSRLAYLSSDDPFRLRFSPEAQQVFNAWLAALEKRIRNDSGLAPAFVAHLSKYRGLMPRLAALFELADRIADDIALESEGDYANVELHHAEQAVRFCKYLESHAHRVYSCMVSLECRAARELARHIRLGDLGDTFTTRAVYGKGWSNLDKSDTTRGALAILEDARWVRRVETPQSPNGGRPSENWLVNPKVRKAGAS